MSRYAERNLYLHLTDPVSLKTLVQEGIEDWILPNEGLRPVLRWAIKYFLDGGLTKAPTPEVMREEWGHLLDDHDIDYDEEPEVTLEWCIENLKSTWVYANSARFAKEIVTKISDEEGHIDRVAALGEAATNLLRVANALEPRTYRVEVRDGIQESLRTHNERKAAPAEIRGMRLGLGPIDTFTGGIMDGELAIYAAGPKTGKSFALVHVALAEWRAGRNVCLYSLENTIGMGFDRLACFAAGVDYARWQQGCARDEEVEAVKHFIHEELPSRDNQLWIMQPPIGRQNFDSMVGEAKAREADSLLIDQLTFVELEENTRKPKTERIGDALHHLKRLLNSGRRSMPCLLAHQINREGVKMADRVGYLEMHHLADSAEIERTADWVFGLYASRVDREAERMKMFTLAARRAAPKHFELHWKVGRGQIKYRGEIQIESNY